MRNEWHRAVAAAVGAAAFFLAVEARPCTSIMVGCKASADGSVMTSHTCDSHVNGSDVVVVAARKHKPGDRAALTRWQSDAAAPMQRVFRGPGDWIPQVPETFAYVAGIYGIMNEHQVAIGETTFAGRGELHSDKGLIECDNLTRLMLERARTAREAIRIGGGLIEQYGWRDMGEALTIADAHEVWLMEIVGPGKDAVGAVWAAQRVPDDHVSVVANGSRIGELDLSQPDYFMASKNVRQVAERLGYWDPRGGRPFRFYEAYSPENRTQPLVMRREWRVLSLLAPSLNLSPYSNNFPFSVKPEKPVTPEMVMELFRDTYQGTAFDITQDLTIVDPSGKTVKSPLANPFMPYEMNQMLRLRVGGGWTGERCIARWFCMYATVTQSRSWLPAPVGGIVWLGYANPAMTTYVPIYAGVTDLPEDFKTDGRATGISRRSAWWAFRRVATISGHRWGDMQADVAAVRGPLQERFFAERKAVDREAETLFKQDPAQARAWLTGKTFEACRRATEAYWNLGDLLWNKYDDHW